MKKLFFTAATALVAGITLVGCCCDSAEKKCPEQPEVNSCAPAKCPECKCPECKCEKPQCPKKTGKTVIQATCEKPVCDQPKGDKPDCPKGKCDKPKCGKAKPGKPGCPKGKFDQPRPERKGGNAMQDLREKCPAEMLEIDKKFIAAEDEVFALAKAQGIELPRKKVDLRRIRVYLPEEFKALQEQRGKIPPKEYGKKLRELTEKAYQR